VGSNVREETVASIFRVEESAQLYDITEDHKSHVGVCVYVC
jgi:hypothetical protein